MKNRGDYFLSSVIFSNRYFHDTEEAHKAFKCRIVKLYKILWLYMQHIDYTNQRISAQL